MVWRRLHPRSQFHTRVGFCELSLSARSRFVVNTVVRFCDGSLATGMQQKSILLAKRRRVQFGTIETPHLYAQLVESLGKRTSVVGVESVVFAVWASAV